MRAAFNHHHSAHFQTQAAVGPRFRQGDVVSWRNPSTGAHHGGLVVEFVYPTLGLLLVRGDFGRPSLKTGGVHVQSNRVRIAHVTLERRAGEVQS